MSLRKMMWKLFVVFDILIEQIQLNIITYNYVQHNEDVCTLS